MSVIIALADDALPALQLLMTALQAQTCADFQHICISNGESPHTKQYLTTFPDTRFIYDEIPYQPTPKIQELMINLGQRREYCLKKYQADRFLFLDADIKINETNYFAKLLEIHQEKAQPDIILTQLSYKGNVFPHTPIAKGGIDISNFCISHRIAKTYSYPTDVDPYFGIANDYRFFDSIRYNPTYYLLQSFAEKRW